MSSRAELIVLRMAKELGRIDKVAISQNTGVLTDDAALVVKSLAKDGYLARISQGKYHLTPKGQEVQRHLEMVDRAFQIFIRDLLEAREGATSDRATELLARAFEGIGEVIDINWDGGGLAAYIELWEARKSRQQRLETLPIIHQLRVNDSLEIISYELIEDEDIRAQNRDTIMVKLLRTFLAGLKPGPGWDWLQSEFKEVGQVHRSKQTSDGWSLEIEPWEEVRVRNIKRRGDPPIVTYEMKIKVADGKREMTSCEQLVDGIPARRY